MALQGDIGRTVGCGIYEQRSSTCRGLTLGDARCHEARWQHGLAPLAAKERAWGEIPA